MYFRNQIILKNDSKRETLPQTIRIYSQNIGMEILIGK